MSRWNWARVLGLAVAWVVTFQGTPGARADSVGATLDGRPITMEEAEALSCHDFDYPVLTCFKDSAEMEWVAAARFAAQEATSAASSGYVVAYENGNYTSPSRTISQSYAYLGDIGFNDKISSFKSYGATGRFMEHAPSGGLVYSFSGSTWVSYVGDTYNDKFSSVTLY
jgi:hypothetical protein